MSHRRTRCRQDRHRRGPGPAHRQQGGPLQTAGQGGLSAGPDRPCGGYPVPRPV